MGMSVSFVKLKSTETLVSGDEGVSIDKLRKGKGLLRTRKGEVGFLNIICDDERRSCDLFLVSLFLLIE